MRPTVLSSLLLVAALAAVGCSSKASQEARQDPAPAEAARRPVELRISVDGAVVATLDPGQAGNYPPLASLVPTEAAAYERWARLELSGGSRTVTLPTPAVRHPGLVAAVYPSAGTFALGFFAPQDLARKAPPQRSYGDLRELRLVLGPPVAVPPAPPSAAPVAAGGAGGGDGEGGGGEGGERPSPSAEQVIVVAVGGVERKVTGAQLGALPTATAPSGDTATPGWTLQQVLAAAGAKPKGRLVLHGTEGANLVLEPADLDPAKATPFIKLNRSGQLRFRLFRKAGSGFELAGELRGLARVEDAPAR